MARVLLLGTWLTSLDTVREALQRRNEGRLAFSGLAGQIEVTGPRIEIERGWIVNERTWKHGMPRSVAQGAVERFTDDLFVVVDEPAEDQGRGLRRGRG
jgi:hypothetical protein